MCSLNLITCPSVKISIFLVQEYTISTQYTKLHENILNLKTFYKINVCIYKQWTLFMQQIF